MASGEAEPLQYTTTALRVSIHCEGCRKKVKKVLHSIEGVYKVTVDAAQHKVTVTGSVEAGALVRRLHKAGKQAAPWPTPAPANVEAKKAAPAALPAAPGEGGAKEAADAKPKDKPAEAEGKEKKPAKDKGSGKNAGTGEAADAKPGKDEPSSDAAEVIAAPKETDKGSPEPEVAKPDAAEEPSGGEGRKKGKKNKKNKPKDGGEVEAPAPAAAPEKKAPHQPSVVPSPAPAPSRPHGGAFPCYAAQPVLSYNVAHPSSSVSYCAPTAAVPMHPMPPPPPQMVPYWYAPYPAMVPVPAELVYGPPGVHESYNNMFNEDNANSCRLM